MLKLATKGEERLLKNGVVIRDNSIKRNYWRHFLWSQEWLRVIFRMPCVTVLRHESKSYISRHETKYLVTSHCHKNIKTGKSSVIFQQSRVSLKSALVWWKKKTDLGVFFRLVHVTGSSRSHRVRVLQFLTVTGFYRCSSKCYYSFSREVIWKMLWSCKLSRYVF